MDTKKIGSVKEPVHPVHHGHPAPDQAEGEREVIDEALAHQEGAEQEKINRQRSGREQRKSPQMARQGKKVA